MPREGGIRRHPIGTRVAADLWRSRRDGPRCPDCRLGRPAVATDHHVRASAIADEASVSRCSERTLGARPLRQRRPFARRCCFCLRPLKSPMTREALDRRAVVSRSKGFSQTAATFSSSGSRRAAAFSGVLPRCGSAEDVRSYSAAAAAIDSTQQRAAGRVEAPTLLSFGEEQRSRRTRSLLVRSESRWRRCGDASFSTRLRQRPARSSRLRGRLR
jgi:hypothetical protein